jgi:predicted secreted hydrolase
MQHRVQGYRPNTCSSEEITLALSNPHSRVLSLLAVLISLMSLAVPAGAVQDQRGETPQVSPVAFEFPRDDGPHDERIEWWYVTGHLFTDSGDRYGFEMVVFKLKLDALVAYASHVAVVDSVTGTFSYDEQLVFGDSASTPVPGGGYNLQLGEWQMSGADGNDRLVGNVPGYAFTLQTRSTKPPALHDGDGLVEYDDGQYSYYYSRTRLETTGILEVDGQELTVRGEAWMDRQWGSFATWEGGGWDWFALQLDDGRDLMLYLTYEPDGSPAIVDGSIVAPDGSLTLLEADDFSVTPTDTWTSPQTGVTYPSGWTVDVPSESLELSVTPVLLDQELDATRSSGQIYWEGQVTVEGTQGGKPVGGLGYVELTGYGERPAIPGAQAS